MTPRLQWLRRFGAADRIDNLRESNRVALCRAGFDPRLPIRIVLAKWRART